MRTGKQIAEEIMELIKQKEELEKAHNILADKIGVESVSYNLMKTKFKEAEQRLGIALEQEYKKPDGKRAPKNPFVKEDDYLPYDSDDRPF